MKSIISIRQRLTLTFIVVFFIGITISGFGLAYSNLIAKPVPTAENSGIWLESYLVYWLISAFSLLIAGGITGYLAGNAITSPILNLIKRIERARQGDLSPIPLPKRRDEIWTLTVAFAQLVDWLRKSGEASEQRVKDRTAALEHRSVQLQAAAEIIRAASTQPDLETLLNRCTELTSELFGYYHVGIFITDDRGEYAFLRAASDEIGRKWVADHTLLAINPADPSSEPNSGNELVRLALTSGQPQTSLLPESTAAQPRTRSQIALPLLRGQRVIGVLDLHSEKNVFLEAGDLPILESIADQLAFAVENLRAIDELKTTVRALEIAQDQSTHTAWQTVVHSAQMVPGYRYQQSRIETTPDQHIEARRAWQTSSTVIAQDESIAGVKHPTTVMAIPIKLRTEVIGVLDLHFQGDRISPSVVQVVEEVSNRLALMLENARLLREAQRLAGREQQINLIAGQVQSSLDLAQILQSTLGGLGKSLHATRGWIRLGFNSTEDADLLGAESRDKSKDFAYQYDQSGVTPADFSIPAETVERIRSGEIIVPAADGPVGPAVIWVPIALRGQAFGMIGLEDLDPNRHWSIEEIQMVTTVANQAAQAVENARLLNETQRLAAREQLVGQITARVRQSLNVESVLRTAAQEIRKALELPEVVIRLGTPSQPVENQHQLQDRQT